ncbi:MAG: twin-arginine translocase subunit TatC [Bacteroidales bacterium]|nr:twin-arginine translocase subunit TatC [Bacteroidales bacterium]
MIKNIVSKDKEMSFLEHLEELRWHLIRSFSAILIFSIVAFIFHNFIFDNILLAPKTSDFFTNRKLCEFGKFIGANNLCINNIPFQIINIKMAGQFSTHIMVSAISGFLIAFPYVFWEFWRFLKPALKSNEKKHSSGAVFFSSLLFLIGVLFGYYIIVPLSVHFLGSYNVSNQVVNQINLDSYISTITSVVLASGIIFELPVIIFFLSKAGIVTPGILKKYRRHSFVIILTLSAIITPPDIFSQILVSLPLVILYEIGINISKRISAKDESRLI